MPLNSRIHRDRDWLDELRSQPCVFTGHVSNDYMANDPAHIGTAGTGIKNHDFLAIPARHDIHALQHREGWSAVFERYRPSWKTMLEWLSAWAVMNYLKHKTGLSTAELVNWIGNNEA